MIFDMEKPKGRTSHNLLIGLVAPRPIALVTSMNEDGVLNAAPFSSYNYLSTDHRHGSHEPVSWWTGPEGYRVEHPADRRVRRQCCDGGSNAENEHLRYGFSCRGERSGD